MKKNFKYLTLQLKISVVLLLLTVCSCNKLVEVQPPVTSITNESVYNTDANAISAITGLYTDIVTNISVYSSSLYLGLYTDELILLGGSGNRALYYQNKLATGVNNSGAGFEVWNSIYPVIYRANEAIIGISNSTKLSASVKQQLLGEAKFMRAFYYFYLTNLYGDVPLILTTDYSQNRIAARNPQTEVFTQIKTDLLDAQNLLNKSFVDGSLIFSSAERLRPTYWAATALLARFYLYTGDWANAENQATILINNSSLFALSTFTNSFLKASLGNKEAIWQLQVTGASAPTEDGRLFALTSAPGNNSVVLSNALLNSFEPGDLRRTNWVGSITVSGTTYYFPNKYKINNSTNTSEYIMMFRLGEQYLIRAEARAQINKLTGAGSAAEDLNIIRNRAGLSATTATTQTGLLSAIYHERQVELFTEQGHRWFDLKRTGLANTLMSSIATAKGSSWSSNGILFPLPYKDLINDPNLQQNPGY